MPCHIKTAGNVVAASRKNFLFSTVLFPQCSSDRPASALNKYSYFLHCHWTQIRRNLQLCLRSSLYILHRKGGIDFRQHQPSGVTLITPCSVMIISTHFIAVKGRRHFFRILCFPFAVCSMATMTFLAPTPSPSHHPFRGTFCRG